MSKVIILFILSSVFVYGAVCAYPKILYPQNEALPRIVKMGGYHVGGKEVNLENLPPQNVTLQPGQPPRPYNPNGHFTSGQMYVHYTLIDKPSSPYPLILIHGGYQTGVCWEDTPDGRPGWQTFFLRAGFNVYVADAVERGRAGWSQFPDIFPSAPLFASKEYAWSTFRIGPPNSYNDTTREAYADSQFPTDQFDQFHKINVPRWTVTDDQITAAYLQLIDQVCKDKCILLGHSQGGTFAYNLTIQRPNKVAAVVTIEPGSSPNLNGFDHSTIAGVKHMTLWGANVLNSTTSWASNWNICLAWVAGLKASNVPIDFIQIIPEYGIVGNSHFLMLDKNSDEIAGIVYTWLVNNSFVTERILETSAGYQTTSASMVLLCLLSILAFFAV